MEARIGSDADGRWTTDPELLRLFRAPEPEQLVGSREDEMIENLTISC